MSSDFEVIINKGPYRLSLQDIEALDDTGMLMANVTMPTRYSTWKETKSILRSLGITRERAAQIAKAAEKALATARHYSDGKVVIRKVPAA